ncbi:non-ribosomal peptide synthetase [Vibrio aerogenes]|uniref:non-ribosomal peptide synthetase n=1 Tax=Vibrio aerogenes TaxID=92172 RepID=UPI0021C339E9|nr:non-ribosomal peptide synthetase [Vibrio aerogenes]
MDQNKKSNPVSELPEDEVVRLFQLAKAKGLKRKKKAANRTIEPVARSEEGEPLGLAQRRIWFLSEMEQETSEAYIINGAYRLEGQLDIDALQTTLDRLAARHESLRTCFSRHDGQPVQKILPAETGFRFTHADASNTDLSAPYLPQFDLTTGPLACAELVRVSDQQHILRVALHHAIADGWSMSVLIGEVGRLYAALTQNQPDPLPLLPVQFADYAHWQQALPAETMQTQKDYWLKQLGDAPEYLDLITDFPRPVVQEHRGNSLKFSLDPALSAALKNLSQRFDTTLFMTLFASWGALMGRLANQDDVVIGIPVAGRNRAELEGLIGMFVNTQALRVDLSDNPDTAALLGQVKATSLAAQSHQDIPFEQVVEAIAPTRDPSRSPVFQVLFALQNLPDATLTLPGLTLSAVDEPMSTAKFELSLLIDECGDQLCGYLNYATALFSEATITRYLNYWIRLLEGMVAEPETAVKALPLLDEPEYQQVIHQFNDTRYDYPSDIGVHSLFSRQAQKTPDALAVVYENGMPDGGHMDYATLENRANQLAHRLIEAGVSRGQFVVISLPRSLQLVVAELAILKCGAAYVPMDPNAPQDRLDFVLADCGATVIVAAGEPVVVDADVQIINIDAVSEEAILQGQALQGQAAVDVPVRGHDPAYVMYTSGSTGKPKGVMIPHQGIARLVINNGYMEIDPADRVAFAVNPVFDVSTMELWGPLLNGASVVVISQETLLDADAFSAALSRHQVSILWLTVGLFNQYATRIGPVFAGLKYLLVGGDALDPKTIRQVLLNHPPQKLLNGYGPTEATTFALTHDIQSVGEQDASIPLGRPIGNTQIYVLNDNRQPVPCGVAGEIYIAGDGVALEYLGRPELTAASFLPDPFSDQPGARMYKSGDLGYWRQDGILEFLGRNDFQVKIRGFRIELGEIEAALRDCAGVQQALVIAPTLPSGEKRLVAYVSGQDLCAETLKEKLGGRLPAYMVPAAFMVLEQMPLNANGKVDRKALPAPDESAFARAEYEPPQGETEQLLAGIWQSLLSIAQVSRHDNFFELGGHSLLAVQMIEQLRQHQMHLAVRDLFSHPTVAGLAPVLAGQSAAQTAVPPNLIPPSCQAITPQMLPLAELTQAEIDTVAARVDGGMVNIQDIYPLAPLQEGILFHHLLQQDGDPYVTRFIQALRDESEVDAFLAALEPVIQRHDILRTAVVWEGLESPVQVVWRQAPVRVQTLDLTHSEDVATALQQHVDPAHTRMDVQRAPMIEAYKVADPAHNRWLLCFLCHHLCNDHTTLELVVEEVMAHLAGQADQLPQPLPFRNFVARSRSVSDAEHQAYFTRQLAEIDEPCAPFGLLNVRHNGEQNENLNVALDASLAQRLRRLARQRGMSPATLFHLAWGMVTRAATGQNDVVFGTVLFGRMDGGEGADRVMGMFLNTLPLRLSLADLTAEQALQHTRDQLAGLLAHEHASLVQAQQCSGVDAGTPLFSALLNYRYQGGSQQLETPAPLKMSVVFAEESTNYPLNLSVNDIDGADFSLDVMVTRQIGAERIAGMMTTALAGLADALEQRSATDIIRLNVLPEAQLNQVLHGFNQTRKTFRHNVCIYQLFERFDWETPDAVALVSDHESLTYEQLNSRANRLAHWLIAQGIQPDDRVGVAVPRHVDLIVAMLATFKAGGVYVPMDPNYPDSRLLHILTDSAPKVLITTADVAPRFAQTQGGWKKIDIQRHQSRWAKQPDHNPQVEGLTPHHLAYLIYTSGSTGLPKGVMVPHHGLCNVASAQRRLFNVGADSRVLQFSSISFDASVFDMVMGLCTGAALHLAGPSQLLGDALSDVLEARQITHVTLPPAALSSLDPARALPDLKVLITAGEALTRAVIEPWLDGRKVFNAYGPTETTIWATTAALHQPFTGQPSIGQPVENTRIYILDAQGVPVPVGVCGEIYIGGVGIARGYLNRDDLTQERFLIDPFSDQPDARMYRTGDLASWRPDGTIDYLGRSDQQVKIRGHRIEPGEIETALQQCQGVGSAVVVAAKDPSGYLSLTGYYTLSSKAGSSEMPETHVTPAALKARLSECLPEYMVPAAYVMLDALPLTPNGKVDLKALPAPDDSARVTRQYHAPQGETETALAGIWQQLLGVAQVGRDDHFFELGGHSLLAVQLISRIRSVLGCELSLTTLFAAPVLHALAGEISGQQTSPDALPEITPLAQGVRPPLSLAQQRLWFLSQMAPSATAAYTITRAVRLNGALNVGALQQALDEIVARHAPLRTCFADEDGVPVQVIGEATQGFPLTCLDAANDASEPCFPECFPEFDLSAGPLALGQLIRISDDEHWLHLAMHHIITDGWSMGIFTRELSALYRAFNRGEDSPLAPLTIQYGDYAAWQQTHLAGERLQQQQAYWSTQLKGIPECLSLPASRPRPEYQDYSGATVSLNLDATLTNALKTLSRSHDCTLYMTLLSGWAALMSRLSGQDDVVIGSPVAGRTRTEAEGLIGMFVNSLAIRVGFEDHPDTAGLLAQVKATALQGQSHQDLPFEQVVEAVAPQRNLTHSPVFQVMFALQNMPEESLEADGLILSSPAAEMTTAQVDLSLQVHEAGDSLVATLNYATALFDEPTARRYLHYWRNLLSAMMMAPAQPLSELPLMDEAEYQQIIHGFNADQTQFASEALIHQQFERQAHATPDAVAVVFEEQSLTYGELNHKANQLAHWLREQGVRPDSRVAIALPRCLELPVAILATLKAGGAYVPLDPDYPADRIAYTLHDSKPEVLITTLSVMSQPDGFTTESLDPAMSLVLLDQQTQPWASCPAENIPLQQSGVNCHHLAYIIYTSGSTGKPKGVMIEHRNVIRLMAATQTDYQFGAHDVWTLFHSYAFDFSVWEIWGALLFGGRLVIVPQLTSRSPQDFYLLLCEQGVTVLNQTPSAFRQLISAQGETPAAHQLRYVIFGGEALDLAALTPWYQRPVNAATQLVNMYGITETTVHTTYYPVMAEDAGRAGPSPIGRQLADLRLYILDPHQQPVPVGVAGELYVGGDGVARGYFNRPELTAERFPEDPFVTTPGARMYKSGDMGRWLADGSVEYLGRNDDQVKIRGFRIELGEISSVLQLCDGVQDAFVIAKGDGAEKRLVAYYLPAAVSGTAVTPDELKTRLGTALPDYMIPAAYVVLDEIPLTPNGKIDYRALPEPDEAALIRHEYEAPQSETEQKLAAIWQQLLGIEQVGRHDDFFALGGHSLMAVQLVSRLRTALDTELPLTTLFATPVLHELARALDTMAGASAALPEIVPLGSHENPPLSLAQQRLWFLSQMEPAASAAYVVYSGVRLTGALDVDALQRALNQIVTRHAPLRTRFADAGGVPVQIINDVQQGFPLTWLEGEALQHDIAPFCPEFNLTTGPLVQGQLIHISDEEHWLRLAMHHIITDGWSMGILTRELSALYAAYSQGQADPLPPLSIQYGDYAAWQQTHLQGEVLQQQQAYWKEQLSGIPECLTLPSDRPRPAHMDYRGAAVPVCLDSALTDGLKALSQRHGCTLYMTLLSAWAALMNRLSGEDDVVIGSPVAGRTRAELEGLIGMFVNTQALRVDLSGQPDTASLLSQVRATSLAAQANQDLPFEQVVEAVAPGRSLNHSPVFQVMFALQNMPEEMLEADGLTFSSLPAEMNTAQVDLSLLMYETANGLEGMLNFATALFDEKTVQRYLGYWQQLLAGMVANPDAPVSTLSLMDEAEYQQVTELFNQTQADYPSDTGVHSLYTRLAQQQPDAPAIIYPDLVTTQTQAAEEVCWRYAALEAAANALAGRLLASGVNPGQCVATLLPRSPQLIVAELAILKCGAVYVPLDPSTPPDRRDYVLSDCGAELILTEEGCHVDVSAQLLTVTEEMLSQSGAPVVDTQVRGDAPAYVMYTSGSTGQPKGVVVPHRAIVRLVIDNGYMDVSPSDRVAFAANPAFDATTMEVWAPLLNGASVVVVRQETLLNVDALATTLTDHQVNILWLTVGLFNQYADGLGQALSRLKYLLVGGDALDPKVIRQVLTDNPPEKLLNGYGPTETTTFALTHEIDSVSKDAVSIPLGRPIANTQIYLLDSHRQPVPRGVIGEIYIGGDGVALGYLGQPELTQNSFMPDPFSASPDARMYKSGDTGYWRADGTLEFAGRNDFQVKIRGFRIEPGEIEAALQACDGVQKALVIARTQASGEKQLVAYVTGTDLTAASLKARLGESLPAYMIPAAYVVLDQMPLTSNGKIDRRALPAPDESAFVTRTYEAPEGAMEIRLAAIWEQLLGVKQVGRQDDFFELGGHSLLAVQLIAEVRHQLNLEVTITQLFENASLSAFAAKLAYIKLSAFSSQDIEKVMQRLSKGKMND